ncbi:hypothetical protein [Mucilaginibacter flavidus]|uniref:hypothetical protein n=1 Tax=Mucilaginibacter flavidus TaxID=2949309 RepID=UPI0020930482|nr:hypothetical protein [Mucilaginibacter flavidus]MCO5950883.1 hypothetical protein [Mucilaginibacter flavidus]
MLHAATLNIEYEVKDLVRTIDFYDILFGESAADLYEGHVIYALRKQLLTITFIENPKVTVPICGNFSFLFNSDKEVYERFVQFTRAGFANTLKADYNSFGPSNHSFGITDPNGLNWKFNIKDKKINTFKFFNIPRVNSVWDILKPL